MLTFKDFMADNSNVYTNIASFLNEIAKKKNYEVASSLPKGKPGKNVKAMREYRLQLINKENDTSDVFIPFLNNELKRSVIAKNIKFNAVSPNSSKFPSYTFEIGDVLVDAIIARGANKGENFEVKTVENLGKYFLGSNDKTFADLIDLMNEENPTFAGREIAKVKQRTGSTKKEGVPIEKLGSIIGDIVLIDTMGDEWFISLKDVNGNTFSSYSGAASLFDNNGNLQPKSAGADFLIAFGVDLNKVQAGFDERNNYAGIRPQLQVKQSDKSKMKSIFERAWGMNYFYVRKITNGWKVFWLDRSKLNKLTSNIKVTAIKYPSKKSKQISIYAEVLGQKYLIEIRNSKAGEYPNDIKFKVIP
jgi:hypothetical protein